MSLRNRSLLITLLIIWGMLLFLLLWVWQLVPDEDSDYVFQEIRVLTLDEKLLQINYPIHLFPEKTVSTHSRITFVLLDQLAQLPSTSPTNNAPNCNIAPATVVNTPVPTLQATPSLSILPTTQIPNNQPTQSIQKNIAYRFLLDNPDGRIAFLDDKGNRVISEIIFTDDYDFSPKFIYLGTNNPKLFQQQKSICIYISGVNLAAPISISINVDGNIFKYLNDIRSTLIWVIVGGIFPLLVGFINDYKKIIEADDEKINELRKNLEGYLATRKWDRAYQDSKMYWKRSKHYKKAIVEAWNSVHGNGLSEREIKNVRTFIFAFLDNSILKKQNQEISDAVYYILTQLSEFPSLHRATIDFVNKQPQQFINKRILGEVTKFQNRIWLAYSRNWEKKELSHNNFVQKTLQELHITTNYFDPDSCECDYEQAVTVFYAKDDVKKNMGENIILKLNSDTSQNLLVWETERQGGRSTLGVWCLREIFAEVMERGSNLYIFPIYIRITNELSLDVIERQVAEHLLSYLALVPEEYSNANKRGAKDAISSLIKSKINTVDIKSRFETLARDFGSNKEELDRLINIIEKYKKKTGEENEDERIRRMSLSLPGLFQGLLFIIDFSDFSRQEVEFLEMLYSRALLFKTISILALIPLSREPYQLNVSHHAMSLNYATEDVAKILEYRLKYHKYSGSVDGLLTIIRNHAQDAEINLPSKQFISAARGRPGLLFRKAKDLLESIGNNNRDTLLDVYALFYVPDHILRVQGKKSIIVQSQSDLIPIRDFIQSLNKLESVQYVENDWQSQLTLRVKSVYDMGVDDNTQCKIELFFYEIKSGYVRNQPNTIERVRQDIVRNFSELVPETSGQDNATNKSTIPFSRTVARKERGLLLRMSPQSTELPGQIRYLYIDRNFEYMVLIKNIDESKETYLVAMIDDFYDWN